MKVFAIITLCLAQALGGPITQPLESVGDLNMPGFTLLNMALNDGAVDVAPGLARMPPRPNDDLGGTMAQFFDEMAQSCRFFGRAEMAASFEALRDSAPDMAELAEIHNAVPQTWTFLLSLRAEGLAIINLRTFVANTMETMAGPGSNLISDIRTLVNDLKSKKQDLIALKVAVKELIDEFDAQFSLQVADLAEILRILANQLGDLGNNRGEVAVDMMALFKAVNKQKKDLYNAVVDISKEWKRIESGLVKIVGEKEVAPISAKVSELTKITQTEIDDLSGALVYTVTAARRSYESMLELFPAINALLKV